MDDLEILSKLSNPVIAAGVLLLGYLQVLQQFKDNGKRNGNGKDGHFGYSSYVMQDRVESWAVEAPHVAREIKEILESHTEILDRQTTILQGLHNSVQGVILKQRLEEGKDRV